MKRLGAVAALIVGSLLLTSCSLVPPNLEEFFDWREKFFLTMSFSDIDALFGPLLLLLITLALAVGLTALIVNMRNGDPVLSGGYVTSLAIFGAIAMVYLYVPMAKSVGELFLSPDLTLDKVISSLRWSLSMDFTKLFLSGSGLFITLVIPIISALWQIVMLIGAIVGITISAVSHSLKGVWYAISQVIGWALFLSLYNGLVWLIGKYYPDWNFDAVSMVVNAFYLGATAILMGACYIGFPIAIARMAPDRIDVPESARRRLKIPLDRLIVFPVPSESGRQEHETEHPEDDGEQPSRRPRPLLPPGPSGSGQSPDGDYGYGRGRRPTPPLLPPGSSDSGQNSGGESGNNSAGFDTSNHEFASDVIELGGVNTEGSNSAGFSRTEQAAGNNKGKSKGYDGKDESDEYELFIHEAAGNPSTGRTLAQDSSQPPTSSSSSSSAQSKVRSDQNTRPKRGTPLVSDDWPGEEIGTNPTERQPNPSFQDNNTAGAQQNPGEDDDFVLEIS